MATLKQVEDAIFAREGFRVTLEPLAGASKTLPAYDVAYPADNRWKVSDWQLARMAKYVPYLRSVAVLKPDGKRATSTLQLGRLRNAYFEALCGDELATAASLDTPDDDSRPKRRLRTV